MRGRLTLACIFTFMIYRCSPDTKTVYVYTDAHEDTVEVESGEGDIVSQDNADTLNNDGNTVDENSPDFQGDDFIQTDEIKGEDQVIFPDQMTDIDLVTDADQIIDLDQETDADQAIYTDQATDSDQVIDFDQSIDLDEINPTDVEDQDDEDLTLDQFVEDDSTSMTEASVSVSSWPIGAQANIVGMEIDFSDQTPFEVVLEYGIYEITMTHPDYIIYTDTFSVPEVTEISVILEQIPINEVEVTFVSAIPEVEVLYVAIDSAYAQTHATPFTHSFQPNSQHTIYCSKDGYIEEFFDIEVGEASFEYQILLQPLSYEALCGWINGEFEFLEGSEPAVDNVYVTSVIFDNHCEVTGLEPPLYSEFDYLLYGEYEPYVYNQLMLICHSPCYGITCLAYEELQVIECSYTRNSELQNITWHKVN